MIKIHARAFTVDVAKHWMGKNQHKPSDGFPIALIDQIRVWPIDVILDRYGIIYPI